MYHKHVCRVVGDDWQFTFNATDPTTSLAVNLTGYTPGGILYQSTTSLLTISGGMVDTSQLSTGVFKLTIPRATTVNYTPDETAYRLRVTLVDTNSLQTTYAVIPLKVLQI